MKKIVIIPTYNEKENIEKIIRKVLSLKANYHVVVVDDGSPDGTADIVKRLQAEFPEEVFLIQRTGKSGLGTAYIAGFKWGLAAGYHFLFEMDADFSHNPNDLERLYESVLKGADMSIGSRYTKGGKVVNWPLDRIFISMGGAFYTRLITWMPVKDPTAGFVCYHRKVLETMPLDEIHFIGYAFQIEMKYRAWKLGFRLSEVPITFIDRVEGVSKMSTNIIKEAISGVWKMRTFYPK
ncbi:MAG: polyprenol monophosphomannose synthase [Chitinophagia bacterium]|nr:polyprenol monophosphomannose synthase [Chitinophagia bacterium]